jgi:hypothetical protein
LERLELLERLERLERNFKASPRSL